MNLYLLKQFFSYAGYTYTNLQHFRQNIPNNISLYSLFMCLFKKHAIALTSQHLIEFMKSFNYQLHETSQEFLHKYARYKFISTKPVLSHDQILQKACQLFMKEWGNGKQVSFNQFSILIRDREQLPSKQRQIQFKTKKHLFDLLEKQLQNLLDLHSFRLALTLQYSNLYDLFQLITVNQEIGKQEVNNLFLRHQQRKTDQQLNSITKRLRLPLNFDKFMEFFLEKRSTTKHREAKIYHSLKGGDKFNSEKPKDKYQTPKVKKMGDDGTTGTKRQTVSRLKRNLVQISQFSLNQTGQPVANWQILGNLLNIQEQFNQKKRNIIIRSDCDLELVYEKFGQIFQDILNNAYGVCNFSAFVRFIVPQNYQHRYLSFIRYKADNKLDHETQQLLYNLIEQYHKKEQEINKLWKSIDRQLVFRGYLLPRQKQISQQQILKYFTKRQALVLLDRMDPQGTGKISFDNFK